MALSSHGRLIPRPDDKVVMSTLLETLDGRNTHEYNNLYEPTLHDQSCSTWLLSGDKFLKPDSVY